MKQLNTILLLGIILIIAIVFINRKPIYILEHRRGYIPEHRRGYIPNNNRHHIYPVKPILPLMHIDSRKV